MFCFVFFFCFFVFRLFFFFVFVFCLFFWGVFLLFFFFFFSRIFCEFVLKITERRWTETVGAKNKSLKKKKERKKEKTEKFFFLNNRRKTILQMSQNILCSFLVAFRILNGSITNNGQRTSNLKTIYNDYSELVPTRGWRYSQYIVLGPQCHEKTRKLFHENIL